MTDILDLIDSALSDNTVSGDAMRSIPDGAPHPGLPALLVRADATVELVTLPGRDNLAAMYTAIGCRSVDAVEVRIGVDAWIDDEGVYTQDINEAGTIVARMLGAHVSYLHGPVLFTGGPDREGDTTALAQHWQYRIHELAAQLRGDDEDD